MTKTVVVNLYKDPYDVYIGRGVEAKWGNPFRVASPTRPGFTREEAIGLYRVYLNSRPDLLAAIIPELKGKRLGCYCAPLPCHGDVLAELADGGVV